jgi:hypothetical protein
VTAGGPAAWQIHLNVWHHDHHDASASDDPTGMPVTRSPVLSGLTDSESDRDGGPGIVDGSHIQST